MSEQGRKAYWTDVRDAEWAFVAPYLIGMPDARTPPLAPLREVFNALRWIVRTGAPWQLLPHVFPTSAVVEQQTRQWITAGSFATIARDLGVLLRLAEVGSGSHDEIAGDLEGPLSSSAHASHPASSGRPWRPAVQGGAAGQTLGERLAHDLEEPTAQGRIPVAGRVAGAQVVVGEGPIDPDDGDRGGLGPATHIRLRVVRAAQASRGFVLVPEPWLADPGFRWRQRLRELIRYYDQLPTRVAGLRTWPPRT